MNKNNIIANKIIRYWNFNQGTVKEYRLMYYDKIINKISSSEVKEKYNYLPIEDFYS